MPFFHCFLVDPGDLDAARQPARFVEPGQGGDQVPARQVPRGPEDYYALDHEFTSIAGAVIRRRRCSFRRFDLPALVADPDLDRLADVVALSGDREPAIIELYLERRPAKLHGKGQPVQVANWLLVELEHPSRISVPR